MSVIFSIFNTMQTIKKLKKKLGDISNFKGMDWLKIALKFILPPVIEIVIIITIFGGAFYSVTGAVGELFNCMKKLYGNSSNPPGSFYSSLSDEQIQKLTDETGASLNPKKISKYIKKESESVPSSKEGTKIVEHGSNGNVSDRQSSRVTIDTSKFTNKYKVNWEFIAAIDLAIFNANKVDSTTAVDNASTLFPVFDWNDTYSRDTTDTERTWEEVYEYDPTTKQSSQVKNTHDQSAETFTTTKEPLAIPNKVTTLFGDYIYNVQEDVVVKSESYCKPYVVSESKSTKEVFDKLVDDYSKPITKVQEVIMVKSTDSGKEYKVSKDINTTFDMDADKVYKYIGTDGDYYVYEYDGFLWWNNKLLIHKGDIPENEVNQDLVFSKMGTETIATGQYEKKKQYKTITITKRQMKETKEKIVEDQAQGPMINFNPTKFIQYLNSNNLSVKDLDLVKEIMLNIPNGNYLLDNIERITSGTYGDIGSGSGSVANGGAVVAGFNSVIPLFIQWDERWKNYPYSGYTVGRAGCGVTSTAMVIAGLGGDISGLAQYDKNKSGILEPDEVAQYAKENGHEAIGEGTYQSLYPDIGRKTGLKVTQTYNTDQVYQALGQGNPIIASMGRGHFTSSSHLMVLTGLTADGKVTVNDPFSPERSKQSWDFSIIKSEANNYFIFENPNFVTETFVATAYYSYTFEDAKRVGTEAAMAKARLQGGSEYTASGLYVGDKDLRNKIIAVSRNQVPLKSKVYISFPSEVKQMTMPDGTVVNTDGYYSAEDTGGAIVNNRIDVYMGPWRMSPQYENLAMQFGRRNITVRFRKH